MSVSVEDVYADALFSLVKEEQGSDGLGKVLIDLQFSETVLFKVETDFMKFLTSPVVPMEDRLAVLEKVFMRIGGDYSQQVFKFLSLLTSKGRIGYLSRIYKSYRKKYNEYFGITEVTATVPYEIDDELKRRLKSRAEAMLKKTVSLDIRIDPSLIGGIIMDYDGHRLDGSLKTRLDELSKSIADTVV